MTFRSKRKHHSKFPECSRCREWKIWKIVLSDKDSADGASEIGDAIVEILTPLFKTEIIESIEIASPTEAKMLECDYVFTANITQKKGGGMFGKFIPPMPGKGGITNPNRETFTRL